MLLPGRLHLSKFPETFLNCVIPWEPNFQFMSLWGSDFSGPNHSTKPNQNKQTNNLWPWTSCCLLWFCWHSAILQIVYAPSEWQGLFGHLFSSHWLFFPSWFYSPSIFIPLSQFSSSPCMDPLQTSTFEVNMIPFIRTLGKDYWFQKNPNPDFSCPISMTVSCDPQEFRKPQISVSKGF